MVPEFNVTDNLVVAIYAYNNYGVSQASNQIVVDNN